MAIPFQFDYAGDFQQGRACVVQNGRIGYIDKTGQVVISTNMSPEELEDRGFYHWKYFLQFQEGHVPCYETNGKWGYLDTKGNMVIPGVYDVVEPFADGLAWVKKGEKEGIIDTAGKEIIPLGKYKKCEMLGEGVIAVSNDVDDGLFNQFYLADRSGKIISQVIEGYPYTGLSEGVFLVTQYEDDAFGAAEIEVKDCYVAYNATGKALWDFPIYKTEQKNGNYLLHDYELRESCNGRIAYGLCLDTYYPGVKDCIVEEIWGYLDSKTGNVVVPAKYKMVGNYAENVAFVVSQTNVVDIIDLQGRCYTDDILLADMASYSDYESIKFSDGKAIFEELEGNVIKDKLGRNLHDAIRNLDDLTVQENWTWDEYVAQKDALLEDATFEQQFYGMMVLSNPLQSDSIEKQPAAAQGKKAVPTSSAVLVDGTSVAFEAYNIEGNNYFKLRDLAVAFSGSDKQFSVHWDEDKQAINLQSNQSYTGRIIVNGNAKLRNAVINKAVIYKDSEEVTLRSYNIDGSTYFKLRDIGKLFGFAVKYDAVKNQITV